MTPLQRYIAEEIATDHLDGLLPRREALRRLSLLGIGAAAAAALIAACGEAQQSSPGPSPSAAPETTTSRTASPPGLERALPTAAVRWAGPRGELQGAWAAAPEPRGAVLVIHENKGLTDHIRSVAGRFAGIGYPALAIDLLSAQGGTAAFADQAAATAALSKIEPPEFIADLLAAGTPALAAAVPFYGPAPDDSDFGGSREAAVLAFYGALDQRVNATEPVVRGALEKAAMVHELITEPDANHAFFNDTGDRYNPVAAADAWHRIQDWFAAHLA